MADSSKGRAGSTPSGRLSESLEDYLEIILQLQQEKRVARVRDIASRKGVSNASVSNALARLDRDGFVVHEAHEFVQLTDRGAELARRVLRRHEFLVSFLREVLLVSPNTAEQDACSIEHQVSPETLERLATFYQFVCSCPKAGAGVLKAFAACCMSDSGKSGGFDRSSCNECRIGDVHENVAADDGLVPLTCLAPGQEGALVRLALDSPGRERLVDAGLLPNVRIEVTQVEDNGGIRASIQGCDVDLTQKEASGIVVRRV